MNSADIDKARNTLGRCLRQPGFLSRFYKLFLSSSPEVAKKFENTDFEKQKKALEESLYVMLVAAGTTRGVGHTELEKVAERHSRRDRDIRPELYDLWLDCLVEAVKQTDPDHDEETERCFRDALGDGIEFIKSRY